MTQSIRLMNLKGYIYAGNNCPLVITEIAVHQAGQDVAISSISSYNNSIANINSLLTPGNTDAVTITTAMYITGVANFYIQLDLATQISTRKHILVKIKAKSIAGAIFSFDIYAYTQPTNNGNNTAANGYYKVQYKLPTAYPGDLQFPDNPVFNANYINGISLWDSVNKNSVSLIEDDNVGFRFTSASNVGALRSNLAPSTGKWIIEIEDFSSTSPGIAIGLCAPSVDLTPVGTNGQIGAESNGNSFLFTCYNDNSFWYKNSKTSSEVIALVNQYPPGQGPSINSGILNWSGALSVNRIAYALIDLDNRKFSILDGRGLLYCSVNIPWAGAAHFAIEINSVTYITSTYANVNFGYYPFRIPIPEDYLTGYGAEIKETFPISIFNKKKYSLSNKIIGQRPAHDPYPLRKFDEQILSYNNFTVDELNNIPALASYGSEDFDTSFILSDFRGFGYFKSNVLKGTSSLVPIRTTVILVEATTLEVVASTMSDATTGEFEFTYISEWRKFNILAFDPQLGWVTAIGGPFKATRMPNAGDAVFIET